ncbi:distal tail protein Dit [Enterococcus saccharolyticus]|uniref:distal tail protein Dit n=1 Tax=Enterococcus saccharolyticus TaxID=41997 RepID=UPI0039DF52EE
MLINDSLEHIYFNGIDSRNFFYIREIESTFVNKDVQTDDRETVDGVQLKRTKLGAKEFNVKIFLTVDDMVEQGIRNIQDLRRTVSNYFNTTKPVQFIRSKDPEVYQNVIMTSISKPEFFTNQTCSVDITLLNPTGVEYSIYSTNVNNVNDQNSSKNLIFYPEFTNKGKYWQDFTFVEPTDKYNGSKVLTGIFDEDTDKIYGKDRAWIKHENKYFVKDIKKGDKFSASLWVRLNEAASSTRYFTVALTEYSNKDSNNIGLKMIEVNNLVVGQWTQIKIENYSIKNTKTRYVGLVPHTTNHCNISISKPQINKGATLQPYENKLITLDNSLTVYNGGSYKSYPILRANMIGENGVISFVSSTGAILQFGNPEEVDGAKAVQSNRVINEPFNKSMPPTAKINQGVFTYPKMADGRLNVQTGSWNTKAKDVISPNYSNTKIDGWNGPSFTMPVPANYLTRNDGDFEYKMRFNFKTTAKERGRIQVQLSSSDTNKPIYGFVIRDSEASKNQLIVEFQINGAVGERSYSLNLKTFNGSFFELKIQRKGKQVIFTVGQIQSLTGGVSFKKGAVFSKSFTNEQYRNQTITNLNCWIMRYKNSPACLMRLTDAQFTWVNTPIWKDAKNLYEDGDEVVVDVKSRTLYINGVEETDSAYHALGNDWDKFVIPPLQDTTIQVVPSDWGFVPEVDIQFTEAYI